MELLGHRGISLGRLIDDDWNEECLLVHDIAGPVHRYRPLAAEVPLIALFRIGRDNRNEKTAVIDLLADLLIPGVPAPQLALIEPHLDASGPQRIAKSPYGLGVLRRAQLVRDRGIAKQPRHPGQRLQMIGASALWRQRQKNEIDRLAACLTQISLSTATAHA